MNELARELDRVMEKRGYTPQEMIILYDSLKIINSISIFCALFAMLTYLLFKRKFPSTLATLFCLFSFLISFSLEMGVVIGLDKVLTTGWLCKLQGNLLFSNFFSKNKTIPSPILRNLTPIFRISIDLDLSHHFVKKIPIFLFL